MSGEADAVELLLRSYFDCDCREEEAKWEKARILAELVKYRPVTWIALRIGKSPAYVRMMVQTYNTFPEEKDRRKELSFYHHRLAAEAKIGDPKKWIEIAAREKLSTRGLRERIRGPKDPAPSFRQIIAALERENERLQAENDRLKNIIRAIGRKISLVA